MMVISPDEGGMGRAVYFANVLGLDMGMFYKRRDYTKIVNGLTLSLHTNSLVLTLKEKTLLSLMI